MKSTSFCFIAIILVFTTISFAQKPALPTNIIPDGLGYNIHFTHAKPGEMEMIADSGVTIIRMDFHWGGTERDKGVYDFKAFDHLTDSLEKHKIRPLYILDYSNRHYDRGLSPHSEEGRTAFAQWAVAAALHFKDRGILWEMYNEPNIGFWRPKPDPEKYILLALEVGRAIRQAAPNELYIGPGTAQSPILHTIDYPFLEQCFKAGLLEYWDAVSVHPYRQKGPETVAEEYARLRHLIDRYAPAGKKIPILSAEWGFSSAWGNFDDDKQGKMLPRQWMTNLAFDVPISIWYDWHDDGQDPKEAEHHFGTTNFEYLKDQTPVYKPKDSYIAAKTFNDTFKGFRYNKRIWTGDDEVYVFLFDKNDGKTVKLAAWTMSKEPKEIMIPCPAGTFEAVSYLGKKQSDLAATAGGLKLIVSDGPVYLTPKDQGDYWQSVSRIPSIPLAVCSETNRRSKDSEPFLETDKIKNHGIEIVQKTARFSPAPLTVSMPILEGKELVATIKNPAGEPFAGEYRLENVQGLEIDNLVQKISTKQGEKETRAQFPLKNAPKAEYAFSAKLVDAANTIQAEFPRRTMRSFADFSKLNNENLAAAWTVVPDGDKNVGSEQKIELDAGRLSLTFKYDVGWKFVRIVPKTDETRKIADKPKSMSMQVQGDGTPVNINIRFRDAKGQIFQVHGAHLQDTAKHNLIFALDGSAGSHWGGPNDGTVYYPIQLDSIIVDGTRKAIGPGTVKISSPVLMYE